MFGSADRIRAHCMLKVSHPTTTRFANVYARVRSFLVFKAAVTEGSAIDLHDSRFLPCLFPSMVVITRRNYDGKELKRGLFRANP